MSGWRRTRVRLATREERLPYVAKGAIRVYILTLRHLCPNMPWNKPPPCACDGTTIVVWDGVATGQATISGRYYVTCSAHQTRTYYSRKRAIPAAKDCSFCPECRKTFLRQSYCHMCGAPTRGCAMCL